MAGTPWNGLVGTFQDLGAHWVWFCLQEAPLHRPLPKLKALRTALRCRRVHQGLTLSRTGVQVILVDGSPPAHHTVIPAVCSTSKGTCRARNHCYQNLGACCFQRDYTLARTLVHCYNPSSVFASSLWARRVSLAYFWSSSIFFLRTRASSISC